MAPWPPAPQPPRPGGLSSMVAGSTAGSASASASASLAAGSTATSRLSPLPWPPAQRRFRMTEGHGRATGDLARRPRAAGASSSFRSAAAGYSPQICRISRRRLQEEKSKRRLSRRRLQEEKSNGPEWFLRGYDVCSYGHEPDGVGPSLVTESLQDSDITQVPVSGAPVPLVVTTESFELVYLHGLTDDINKETSIDLPYGIVRSFGAVNIHTFGLTTPVRQARHLYPTNEDIRQMIHSIAVNQMNRSQAQARETLRLKKARSESNRLNRERDLQWMKQREEVEATFLRGTRKYRKHVAKGGIIGDKDGIARSVSYIRALPARK